MSYYIGEIILFGGIKIPPGFLPCDGRELRVKDNPALYTIILNNFGGTPEKTFRLPDLRGRSPIGLSVSESASHSRHQLGESGGGEKLTSAAGMKEATPTPTSGSQAAATEQPVQVKATRDPYLTIRYLICVGNQGVDCEYPVTDEEAHDM